MTAATSTNFDQTELDKFAALATRWWDADGPQKPLHVLNPVRLRYVAGLRDALRDWPLPCAPCWNTKALAGTPSRGMPSSGSRATFSTVCPRRPKWPRSGKKCRTSFLVSCQKCGNAV